MSTLNPTHDHLLPMLDGATSGPSSSAVSWGAILAGAAAAAALSLILLILGTGLGLAFVSPWAQNSVSAGTFGVSTILWVTLTQLAAAAVGGYLAGRLRTKWVAVHGDEVYFRDTAHGFLSWAVASVATAALLSSVIGSIVGGGVQAGATATSGAVNAAAAAATGAAATSADMSKPNGDFSSMGYYVDSLFRGETTETPSAGANEPAVSSAAAPPPTAEVGRIFASSAGADALPAEDVRYLGSIIAQRTGLSRAEAEKRVTDTYARMQAKLREASDNVKATAEKARKASSYAALWLFISLLGGAFVGSLAATYGGRQRDL
ncbi:MAG: hypothetical protein ABI640_07295 [Gammaproteobacteria bacterium]